jgi:hypothetical protein
MVSLRMPTELRARLEERAAKSHRTLSQELTRVAELSLSPDLMVGDAIYTVKSAGGTLQPEDVVRAAVSAAYGAHNAAIAIDLLNALVAAEMAAKQGGAFQLPSERAARIVNAVHTITKDISIARNKSSYLKTAKLK